MAGLNCKINLCPVNEVITEEVIKAAKIEAEKQKRFIKHVGKQTTLDDWKLTIPENYGGFYSGVSKELAKNEIDVNKAAEILPSECSVDGSSLTAATKNDYFWADEKGWHFRTPLDGGATTPNSTYIRSELRELAGDWAPCGDTSLANWEYGGEHTLVATLSLDEIPHLPLKKDGITPTDPKVVLGQIHAHDISAATAKLLWEGNDKPVRVILNKSTEKSAFSVKLGKIDDPSQPWSYKIKMTARGIELSAGGVTKKLSFGKELDGAWKNETFYFKAGLYPQVYKEFGGAFEATFSKLSIEHKARPGDFGTKVALECDPAVSDCSCLEADPNCTWWDVPLKAPTIPATPLPGNKPGQNFDLTTWYLSQPFDHDFNGRPDDVFEQHLNQGYEHPEHFYTADDGGMVFKSFIKGVRTSKNTKYVRTELREMLRAGDMSIPTKGVNKNNWVFSSAPVEDQKAAAAIDGVMNATLKIDHTTTTGDPSQVGRFIIGQIHDKDDEPIRLYYRKLPDQEMGTVYFAHENTNEGSDKFFDLVGGMKGVTNDGIKLGEVFSYQIKVVGNTMTVTVMREGKPDAVQVVDMSESGYDQGGRYMYFKAGVYNQNNTGDPDDYVQATFYKLEKSHSQYQE
ncbi:polysaccharide lyase family 7 protein [Vibrio sp. RC27]